MADALVVDGTPVGTDHGKPAMSTGSTRDVFGAAYRTDVTSATGPPPTSGVKAPPPAPFALRGSVLTPTGALRRAYVVVAGGLVHEVRTTKPSGVHVLETDGVIMPGMLDLHGHPEFNVFAAWEPPRRYSNRYIWRSDDLYRELVRDPQNRLLTALPSKTQLRYAEARALVGGVTAIQGASAKTVQHADSEPLVRNVDLWIFGQHRARSMIDLPSGKSGRSWDQLVKVLAAIEADEVDAFFLHLCEGRRDDKRSQTEFAKFIEFGAATPSTVIIHATALSPEQLDQVHDAGCSLVWSPQSNLRLYAETTLASHAISIGMDVALGADWLPSGSTSLLAELQVARRALHEQGLDLEPARLVEMVTSTAARVAGLSSKLGALAAGRPADVVVLQRRDDDPYESVCQSDPACVELVLIGGDVSYGRADWFDELTDSAGSPTIEDLVAWGRPMRLDTGFQSGGQPAPSLAEVRAALIGAYPQVGPIFA